MARLPKKASERIAAGLKRFQPILATAKSRDVNESDTVVIVTDLLQEIFGYDKYAEITSEHMIRGTFCDLAVKLDGTLAFLIEVKAIGLDLKEQFVKQAVDYAANQGVEWVVLTNGTVWKIYKISFTKPIAQELVVDFDLDAFGEIVFRKFRLLVSFLGKLQNPALGNMLLQELNGFGAVGQAQESGYAGASQQR